MSLRIMPVALIFLMSESLTGQYLLGWVDEEISGVFYHRGISTVNLSAAGRPIQSRRPNPTDPARLTLARTLARTWLIHNYRYG